MYDQNNQPIEGKNAGKLYWGLTIKGRRYRDEMIVVKENMMSVDNTEE